MKAFGYTVTTILIFFFGAIWSGYVLSILWLWFVVSAFSVPEISIPTAIGLAMIISYIAKNDTEEDKGKEYNEKLLNMALKLAIKPALALFFGWIITLFL